MTLFSSNQAICKILQQEDAGQQGLFLLEGATRSGKTNVLNQLLEEFKARDKTVTMGAWTHWSAAKLKQGRTICSIFCLDFENEHQANIPDNLYLDLQNNDVFLLDGVNLLPLEAFESLADALGHDVGNPFGGKTVILAADFGKIGPVDCESINGSTILDSFERIDLKPKEGDKWGMELVNIREVTNVDWSEFQKIEAYNHLLTSFWPNQVVTDNSIILTPRRKHSKVINKRFFDRLPGDNIEIVSVSSIVSHDDRKEHMDLKFYRYGDVAGVPSHILNLKVGSLIKLMHYTNCLEEGSRLVVQKIGQEHLTCRILEEKRFGEISEIPKREIDSKVITLEQESFSFQVRRFQFPVQIDFAGTIHANSRSRGERSPA